MTRNQISYDYGHMNRIDLPGLLRELPDGARIERTYDKGDLVFQQGDACGGIWFIQSGRVDLQRVTETGHLVLIHRALKSESFAEASLFSARYHCTARVVQAGTTLIELERAALLGAMGADSAFAANLCAMLAGQVQSYRRQVEVLSIRKADERVFVAVAHGMLGDDIKAFAAQIALSHEVVYRALSSLARQGRMVKLARGQYEIVNKEQAKLPDSGIWALPYPIGKR